MDERIKESMSALVDDEANELEMQRVLSSLDNELVETWSRYHTIRDTVSGNGDALPQIDLRQSLANELGYDLDDTPAQTGAKTIVTSTIRMSVNSVNELPQYEVSEPIKAQSFGASVFGIAASAVLALVLATQYQNSLKYPSTENELVASTAVQNQSVDKDAVFVELSSGFGDAGAATVGNFGSDRQPKIIVQLSDEHAKQFNQYLLRHAENSVYGFSQGVMPLARVASVNSVGL